MDSGNLLDLHGIARLLHVSKHTPNQWRNRKVLPEPDYKFQSPLWQKSTIIKWAMETERWPPGTAARPEARKSATASKPAKPRSVPARKPGFRTAQDVAAAIPVVDFSHQDAA